MTETASPGLESPHHSTLRPTVRKSSPLSHAIPDLTQRKLTLPFTTKWGEWRPGCFICTATWSRAHAMSTALAQVLGGPTRGLCSGRLWCSGFTRLCPPFRAQPCPVTSLLLQVSEVLAFPLVQLFTCEDWVAFPNSFHAKQKTGRPLLFVFKLTVLYRQGRKIHVEHNAYYFCRSLSIFMQMNPERRFSSS